MRVWAVSLALLVAALSVPGGAADLAGSIEGRWVLVSQTYEKGSRNLAGADRPVRIEILPAEGAPLVRVYAGGDTAERFSWPAWVVDAGPVPVTVLERTVNFADGFLRARYRFSPQGEDRVQVEVEEAYRAGGARSAETLEGEMTVRFFLYGEPRGSYTLHRRFERERP